MRDRTADPLLAKQVLSQLSYTPISSSSSAFLCGAVHFLNFRISLLKNNDFFTFRILTLDLKLSPSYSALLSP